MRTARLETLADGVFAIVMTLLVFELRVPELPGAAAADLWAGVVRLGPSLLSFIVSFLVLGVYWVGHHSQFQYIRRADQTLLWLNILFLMCVSLVPFSAGMLGRHGEQQLAIILYGGNLILVALTHFCMWWYATQNRRLVDEDIAPAIVGLGKRLSLTPPAFYLLAIALSFISTSLSLLIYIFMLVPYVLGLFYRAGGSDLRDNNA
jgi:uncharacterized membrane protein